MFLAPKTAEKINILFITCRYIGDAILTTGTLSWLVQHYPNAEFTIVCSNFNADLFVGVPRLKNLIIVTKKKWKYHWFEVWQKCRQTYWNIIIDYPNTTISRFLPHQFIYIRQMTSKKEHKLIQNSAVINIEPQSPHIWLIDQEKKKASLLLSDKKIILAICPTSNEKEKTWPIQNFIELISNITCKNHILYDAYIMIIAAAHEGEQLKPLVGSLPPSKTINLIGSNLQFAAACLTYATIYIGNDSGIMHLSAALGLPTLGLFGPSNPLLWAPWGEHCSYVVPSSCKLQMVAGTKCNHIECVDATTVHLAMNRLLLRKKEDAT